jgi:hypothetical protein
MPEVEQYLVSDTIIMNCAMSDPLIIQCPGQQCSRQGAEVNNL